MIRLISSMYFIVISFDANLGLLLVFILFFAPVPLFYFKAKSLIFFFRGEAASRLRRLIAQVGESQCLG